jgi:hypothetical protein
MSATSIKVPFNIGVVVVSLSLPVAASDAALSHRMLPSRGRELSLRWYAVALRGYQLPPQRNADQTASPDASVESYTPTEKAVSLAIPGTPLT